MKAAERRWVGRRLRRQARLESERKRKNLGRFCYFFRLRSLSNRAARQSRAPNPAVVCGSLPGHLHEASWSFMVEKEEVDADR